MLRPSRQWPRQARHSRVRCGILCGVESKEKEYAEGSAWYAQRERGAGRLRMAFMWWVYALFGKTALKIAIVPVAACIYAFAAPVRRNLRAFYAAVGQRGRMFRHVLDFAWSLADKVDACTHKKSLPQVSSATCSTSRGLWRTRWMPARARNRYRS